MYNVILKTLVVCGVVGFTAVYAEPLYNAQATKKLQGMIDPINSISELQSRANVEFIQSVDKLLTEGADPNVARQEDREDVLLAYLVALSTFAKQPHILNLLENTMQHALNLGANFDINGDKGSRIMAVAIMVGSARMVQLLIDRGIDLTQRDAEGNTPLTVAENLLQQNRDALQTLSEPMKSRVQKMLPRIEQIRDMLKAAERKK